MQSDLDEAVEFGGENYNLLSSYNHIELYKLANKAKEIELNYVQNVLKGGGTIKEYCCFEEFMQANL